MSNTYLLKAVERENLGTGSARELRRNGMIPAIIYGSKKNPVTVAISARELNMHYHKQGFLSHIFDIEVGKTKYRAIPKQIQLHPVTDEIEHMDFMHVDENQKMKTNVTLHFVNESKCVGIKQGGILNITRHSLEVYCLPGSIPENIEVDIAELNIGSSIHVSDVKLPKDVETKVDGNITVVALVPGKTASEAAE